MALKKMRHMKKTENEDGDEHSLNDDELNVYNGMVTVDDTVSDEQKKRMFDSNADKKWVSVLMKLISKGHATPQIILRRIYESAENTQTNDATSLLVRHIREYIW